jgi:hypothetical protein
MRYLSTHPAVGDRVARLRALSGKVAGASVKLLPAYDWSDIRRICGAR